MIKLLILLASLLVNLTLTAQVKLPEYDFELIAKVMQHKQAHYDRNYERILMIKDKGFKALLNMVIDVKNKNEDIRKEVEVEFKKEYFEISSGWDLDDLKGKDLTLYDDEINRFETRMNNAIYKWIDKMENQNTLEVAQPSKVNINFGRLYGKWNIDSDILEVKKIGTFKWFIKADREELSGTWEIINNTLVLDIGQNRKLLYEILDISDDTIQIRLGRSNGASNSVILIGHKIM